MARLGFHLERAHSMSGTRRIARVRRGPVPQSGVVEKPIRPRRPDGRFDFGASAHRAGDQRSASVLRSRLRAIAVRIVKLPPAVLAAVAFAILIAGLTL